MSFSSIAFLFYFLPMVLLLYYIFKFSTTLKNLVLFCCSLLFYAWGNVGFVFVLLLSIFINYVLALLVDRYRTHRSISKLVLLAMCIFNLAVLFVFKYAGVATVALNDVFDTSFRVWEFSLPIGISFFTFKAVSYVLDVYTKKADVQKNPFYVGLYMSLFPQLAAGPIVQYASITEQLKTREESLNMVSVGCCRFVTGLSKKVLIANNMCIIVDRIYEMSALSPIPATLAWVGAIAYSLQIYYDFSGYSDMAIGICLIFGFKIDENFNYPYMSQSITEFWRRWHISLGQWFQEYIYIPLGGSRVKNKDRIIRNLFVMWLLIGIWHGAEWTFLIWGLLNFAFIAIERLLSIHEMTTHKVLRSIYTLFVVNLLWVVFRADRLEEAGHYMASMFGANGFYSPYSIMFIKENFVFFVVGIIFSVSIARKMNKLIINKAPLAFVLNHIYPIYIITVFFISVTYLIKGTYNPFVYFSF